ncbi:MAG: amino acid transporter protein [Parafilimonas terrae]|nr:amino acid transporter protein [Parafilimonas terrae]
MIANERTKLTATYVNAIAGSIFTVGGLAPIFAVLYTSSPPGVPVPVIIGIAVICWVASGTLHYAARRSAKELQG